MLLILLKPTCQSTPNPMRYMGMHVSTYDAVRIVRWYNKSDNTTQLRQADVQQPKTKDAPVHDTTRKAAHFLHWLP